MADTDETIIVGASDQSANRSANQSNEKSMSDSDETLLSMDSGHGAENGYAGAEGAADATAVTQCGESRIEAFPEIPDVRIESELGRGGMGVVYKGQQVYLDRPVAVKVLLSKNMQGSEQFIQRFQREAKILATLNHPHIVSCYQGGVGGDGNCFLIMEYIEGSDLEQWVKGHGVLPPKQALCVLENMAQALQHAQSSGVIHRDVKPENILLCTHNACVEEPFTPKLVDLGLARPSQKLDMQLTAQGVIMGTPSTMAPEQFDDPDNVDLRADIYGLGCVLYYALVGKAAFAGKTLGAIIETKMHKKTPDPREDAPDMDKGFSLLVEDLLKKDPNERIQNYDELLKRVQQLKTSSLSSSLSSLSKPMPRQKTGLLSGLVIVIIVVAYSILSQPTTDNSQDTAASEHSIQPVPELVIPMVEVSTELQALKDFSQWTLVKDKEANGRWWTSEEFVGIAAYSRNAHAVTAVYDFKAAYFTFATTIQAHVDEKTKSAFKDMKTRVTFSDGSEWVAVISDGGAFVAGNSTPPLWAPIGRENMGMVVDVRKWPMEFVSNAEFISFKFSTYSRKISLKNIFKDPSKVAAYPVSIRFELFGDSIGGNVELHEPHVQYTK